MKKTLLILAILLLNAPGWSKSPQKEALLFSFEEFRWAPHFKSQRLEITKKYEVKQFQNNKLIKKQKISKERYHVFETSFLSALLEEKARHPSTQRVQSKCDPMLQVQLYHLKESLTVCKGDFKTYFKFHPLSKNLNEELK